MSWRGLRTLNLEVIEWALFYEAMGTVPDYSHIWNVVKLVLVLSRGQAGVERGFSVDRNVEKQNLKEETFVSVRVICDHIRAVGGLVDVKIDKALLCSASSARSKKSCPTG